MSRLECANGPARAGRGREAAVRCKKKSFGVGKLAVQPRSVNADTTRLNSAIATGLLNKLS